MDNPEKNKSPVTSVPAQRISTTGASLETVSEDVCVVRETPVVIDVEGIETYTVLCTPADKLAMAAGFLFSEGVIDNMAQVSVLKQCDDDPNMIRVRLHGEASGTRIADPGRNLLIVSSCGACGSEALDERINALPRVGDALRAQNQVLRRVNEALRERQGLFDACGGTHAVAIFDDSGLIISSAEDTGRHNALGHHTGGLPARGRRGSRFLFLRDYDSRKRKKPILRPGSGGKRNFLDPISVD